jgi:hypothetical protein
LQTLQSLYSLYTRAAPVAREKETENKEFAAGLRGRKEKGGRAPGGRPGRNSQKKARKFSPPPRLPSSLCAHSGATVPRDLQRAGLFD